MSGIKYSSAPDPYCYPDTTILINLPELRDPATLEQFELDRTQARSRELLPSGDFDARHYLAVHKHLFQDVYAWAGQVRTVSIAKGPVPFCEPRFIDEQLNALFTDLKRQRYLSGLAPALFCEAASSFLADLNAIHAFREGNGRTQLAFMRMLSLRAGHPFNFMLMDEHAFLNAMVGSFHGTVEPLRDQLLRLLQPD